MTQTPIEQYETLRDTKNAITLTGVEAAAGNTLLNDFSGDCYEIDAALLLAPIPLKSVLNFAGAVAKRQW